MKTKESSFIVSYSNFKTQILPAKIPDMKYLAFVAKTNRRTIILILLIISGIEQNPGPRSAKQMTMESYREKDLAEMIATLTTKIDDLGHRLETRLSSLESGMKELNQRFQHIETSLEKTAKAVSINSERIDSFERRLDLCEMKQRENNLIFYGIEGKECEAPTDTRAIIMNLFSEKMQIQENITIQQCRRLTKKANSPILIEVPEHNERIMLFKNMFRLKNTRIYLNKDYSVKIREQRKLLIKKRKELMGKDRPVPAVIQTHELRTHRIGTATGLKTSDIDRICSKRCWSNSYRTSCSE
ncbi:hypothetical protein LAZ67_1006241 [Cordylochernes scorpioides]|uniref:Endonuclease-reverse transcriptase n=1 Tax=Cordylochernes scorpioides TaxID=51811 RepID=A0ABY6K3E7_9ARAC|nr:hypothetical protein LAZ67_1006241 [Cordylochernes scorpioides]